MADPSPRPAPEGAPPAPPVSSGYLGALFGSAFAAVVGFYALLFTLGATGHLPPPAFSNSICVDEKLAFHRNNPMADANLLVIGSSVAWRHFDGEGVARHAPTVRPLNGAFCGLSADQSVFAAEWFLDRQPTIREVLLIASPQDFENCTTSRTALFNRDDVSAYVDRTASPWLSYLHYFAPGSLLRNAWEIKGKRDGSNGIDPLVFDRYGSGPLDTDGNRDTLLYGLVKRLDPACFQALEGLATRLEGEGKRLMVAATPLHPDWKASDDPRGELHRAFNTAMAAALTPHKAEFWDGDAAGVVSRAAFFDAIHLRWSAAKEYSLALLKAFRLGAPPTTQASLGPARPGL